ncbi:MAG: PTS sugar transporter subunit IIA, partial [Opitutales bacterium]|nr:PTS sugar transporter subunit IIA [Opitutales bacterium]
MRIDRFLSKNRILDLTSRELPAALDELLAVALPAGTPAAERNRLRVELIAREAQMQKRVADWASLPSICTPLVKNTVIAVGRLPKRVPAADAESSEKDAANTGFRVIFLVLAPKQGRSYLTILSELVHALEDEDEKALACVEDLAEFRRVIMKIFRGAERAAPYQDSRWNRQFAKTAARLAKATHCQVL